jgi:hypothetical protein
MKVTIDQCAEALEKSAGFISIAAESLGITCGALSQRIKRSALLRKTLDEIEEKRLDLAESTLLKNMKQKEKPAVSQRATEFYLRYKGRKREYIETSRQIHEGGEQPVTMRVIVEEVKPNAAKRKK